MPSSKTIAILIAVIALLWVLSGVFLSNEAAEENDADVIIVQKEAEAPPRVQVFVSHAQAYQDNVKVTGRTQASRRVEVKAETDGRLSQVLKQEGDNVSRGTVLANIEVEDRQARLQEARQRVEQREIEYNAAQKLAERGFYSQVRLTQSEGDLEAAKAELARAQVELANTRVSAPFDGIIGMQAVEIGDYVRTGDTLFTVLDLDPLEIEGFVSEKNIQDIKLGAPVQASFLNGAALAGTLSFIAPAADPQTRTFRIIASSPNPGLAVKEGLTAEIGIPASTRQAHKISPSILSLDEEGRIGLKIVGDGGRVAFVPVTVLSDQADGMWVSGLPQSARIITVGQEFVMSGQHVEPVEENQAAQQTTADPDIGALPLPEDVDPEKIEKEDE